jgi:hypothetical protein
MTSGSELTAAPQLLLSLSNSHSCLPASSHDCYKQPTRMDGEGPRKEMWTLTGTSTGSQALAL